MQANFVQFLLFFFRFPDVHHGPQRRYARVYKIVQRLRLAVLMVIFSIATGTIGYIWIEHYPLIDAYYMAVITLASVGFSEVHPLSNAGRIFTTCLILFNVGLFAYSISTITGILAEGGFSKIINDLRMNRRIEDLQNHTIVCGFGRHATEVCQELSKQGISFVVIESKHDKVEALRKETNYLLVEGDATQDEVLAEARISEANAIVITLPNDSDNLFITLSARQINPDIRIISRAVQQSDEVKIRRAGADHTVMPERIGGFYMATLVNKPDLVEFFNLLSNMGPSNVIFEEIRVQDLLPEYVGKTLKESGLAEAARVSLIAIRNPNGQYELNPESSTRLLQNWDIVVLGNQEQMAQFRKKACRK